MKSLNFKHFRYFDKLLVEIFKVGVRSRDNIKDADSIRLPTEILTSRDNQGRTTVHHAVSVLCMPILKRLIKMDADLGTLITDWFYF